MKYVYPVLIEEQPDHTYIISAPDLPGVVCGETALPAALEAATAGCEMWLADAEDAGETIPAPTPLKNLDTPEGAQTSLIVADTDSYREKNMNYAVKKTLSIPAWMAYRAEHEGVSLSQTLQEALRAKFAV